jgi:hypothetical protein
MEGDDPSANVHRVVAQAGEGVNASDVTACLVTRGDQPEMMRRIHESLIFDRVIVWDNSEREDFKTYGRYAAIDLSETAAVYVQDDDVVVPPETQQRLVDAYMPDAVIANYGHGENDGGYGDLPLVCGGAVMNRELTERARARYLEHWPFDEDFLYYCDFGIGVLYDDFRHLYLPFHIELPVAQHPSRLVNQPWAAEMKARVTAQGRAVRDMTVPFTGNVLVAQTRYPS